jgi:hypothetical protein
MFLLSLDRQVSIVLIPMFAALAAVFGSFRWHLRREPSR